MGLQKYRADKMTAQQIDGARVWSAIWMGGPSPSKVENCRLDSMAGDMRRTVYITGEADTYFSIPAVCMIQGCRVKGYLTSCEQGLVFNHVYY